MIRELPHKDEDLQMIHTLTGEVAGVTVVGYTKGRKRIVEKAGGWIPLFAHEKDDDGDWVEIDEA